MTIPIQLYKDPVELGLMLSTAELVTRIRTVSGDTQEALARRLGVSFPTVNAWENGRTSPRRGHRLQLEALAEKLGIHHELVVLVIDDDPATGELVASAAVDIDTAIAVNTALDGWEGLVKCGTLRPNMLFLDIMMPGLDGIEVARRLPTIDGLGPIQVVFVTSSRDADLHDRAGRLGHELLLKPLEPEALVEVMRAYLVATTAVG